MTLNNIGYLNDGIEKRNRKEKLADKLIDSVRTNDNPPLLKDINDRVEILKNMKKWLHKPNNHAQMASEAKEGLRHIKEIGYNTYMFGI